MKDLSKLIQSAMWTTFLAMQLACVPVLGPEVAPSSTSQPIGPGAPAMTPTLTPTPAPISRPATLMPTATPFPSATPPSIPTITATPVVALSFRSIQMMDARTGWAVADVGSQEASRVLRTEDGGSSWRDVSPLQANIFDVYILDAQTAWAWSWASGSTWRTLDGGQSWAAVGEFSSASDFDFVDSEHGWQLIAESWGLSFRQFDIISFSTTQDGGRTWQETNPPPAGGVAFMAYPDARTVWAVRAGFAKTIDGVPNLGVPFHIVTSFDGGKTWTTRQMPLPPDTVRMERPYEGAYLGGVGNCEFISPAYSSTGIWKLALTCEDLSWMYTTANQGKTWIISPMPAGAFAQLQFVNPRDGWLFVLDPEDDYLGTLYRTSNGGQGWELLKRTAWKHLSLSFVNDLLGWAVACDMVHCYQQDAERALVQTVDGGRTWQILETRLIP